MAEKLQAITVSGIPSTKIVSYDTFSVNSTPSVPLMRSILGLDNGLVPNRRHTMGLLPDKQNCGLRMRRECQECFPRHRLQRKPRVNDPGTHRGTCLTCLTRGGEENVPGIPGACATHNFKYLLKGPLSKAAMTQFSDVYTCSIRGRLPNGPTHICVTSPRVPHLLTQNASMLQAIYHNLF